MDYGPQEARDEYDALAKHYATQACETCRTKKVKCDEERPRCSVCQRINAICEYREAKPTKKDKTLKLILESLKALEVKVDLVYSQRESLLTSIMAHHASMISQLSPHPQLRSERSNSALGSTGTTPATPTAQARPGFVAVNSPVPKTTQLTGSAMLHHHQIEARELLAWPAVRSFLEYDLLRTLEWAGRYEGGEKWLTRISHEFQSPLPVDELVNFSVLRADGAAVWDHQSTYLTPPLIETLCQAFFRWFHPIYPILDRRHFFAVTLPQALSTSFGQDDGCATVVLLVLALGAVAHEGISADPIVEPSTGRRTGIRGGTIDRTPGLAFLNEARKRHGLVISQYDLVTIQSSILFALYYSQCSRNLEYWRMTSLSCSLCQNVVRTVEDWKSLEGDLLARSYWMCVHLEAGLTTELGLTPTGLAELENSVPLPLFLSTSPADESTKEENLFIEYHFLAQNTLRTLLNRIYMSLRFYDNPFQQERSSDIIPKTLILELERQLQAWREQLPPLLRWNDDDPDLGVGMSNVPAAWQLTVLREQVSQPPHDARIILTASLRTRYKYALYLIWRPYVYKMLHFPDASAEEDLQGCRKAFKACSQWPLTYPIFQEHWRLIPHIYEYSHTFFGILVLLYISQSSPVLRGMLEPFEKQDDLEQSKHYMLRWLRDMQVAHPVARWCWQLLKVIYRDHAVLREGEGGRV